MVYEVIQKTPHYQAYDWEGFITILKQNAETDHLPAFSNFFECCAFLGESGNSYELVTTYGTLTMTENKIITVEGNRPEYLRLDIWDQKEFTERFEILKVGP